MGWLPLPEVWKSEDVNLTSTIRANSHFYLIRAYLPNTWGYCHTWQSILFYIEIIWHFLAKGILWSADKVSYKETKYRKQLHLGLKDEKLVFDVLLYVTCGCIFPPFTAFRSGLWTLWGIGTFHICRYISWFSGRFSSS